MGKMASWLFFTIIFILKISSFRGEEEVKSNTICGMKCLTDCGRASSGRYWCGQWPFSKKDGSWNYCAPTRDIGMGNYGCYTTVDNVVEYTVIAIIAAAALLCFCGVCICRR